jgi:hypothetical protein
MRFKFIDAEKHTCPLAMLCRVDAGDPERLLRLAHTQAERPESARC